MRELDKAHAGVMGRQTAFLRDLSGAARDKAAMKLDDLRARLRRRKPRPKREPAERPKRRLRCSKCRKPREPASLTDPDVAEIVRSNPHPQGKPIGAYRCRACQIIWLIGPIAPEHTNSRCMS